MHIIDLTGQRFNRWTVIRRSENTPQGQARWLCRCDCGTQRTLKSIVIRRGASRSCGCLQSETTTARSTKHGHSQAGRISPTYHTWSGMLARCKNKNNKSYPRYGGAGITVCESWLSFENFLADMGEKPSGKSLDRIDTSLGYTADNCRWATAKQQARNKNNNRLIAFQGETRSLIEWADHLGMKQSTLSYRINTAGWPIEKALATPVR